MSRLDILTVIDAMAAAAGAGAPPPEKETEMTQPTQRLQLALNVRNVTDRPTAS